MILENFSPVALAPRLKDELYSSSLFSITDDFFKKGKETLNAHEKLGINDTIWVNKSIFGSQYYTTLYSWGKKK